MYDPKKFRTLVHYVCHKCTDQPETLGAIKLNKILWFSEVITFIRWDKPITGARYVKRKLGPVPKAILPVLRELVDSGALRIDEVEYYGHQKRQFTSLKEPDMSLFSEDELSLVNEIIEAVTEGHTATSISLKTHDPIWKAAAFGEEIPLYAMLASRLGEVTDSDVEKARQRRKQLAA